MDTRVMLLGNCKMFISPLKSEEWIWIDTLQNKSCLRKELVFSKPLFSVSMLNFQGGTILIYLNWWKWKWWLDHLVEMVIEICLVMAGTDHQFMGRNWKYGDSCKPVLAMRVTDGRLPWQSWQWKRHFYVGNWDRWICLSLLSNHY